MPAPTSWFPKAGCLVIVGVGHSKKDPVLYFQVRKFQGRFNPVPFTKAAEEREEPALHRAVVWVWYSVADSGCPGSRGGGRGSQNPAGFRPESGQ